MSDIDNDQEIDEIEAFEQRQAFGFIKEGGKHIAVDGLVGRSGRRRILPDHAIDDEYEKVILDIRAEIVAEVAANVLRGRSAVVFEARVLDPLFGRPRASIKHLAQQFNCAPDKIYKIIERTKLRIAEAVKTRKSSVASIADCCPTCGFLYQPHGYSQPICPRGYGGSHAYRQPGTNFHPECAPRFPVRWQNISDE